MFGKRNENLINRMLFRDSMKTKMEEIGRSGSNEINQRFRKCIQSVSKSIPSEDDLITMFKQENLILSIKKKGYWEPYTTCDLKQSCVVCGFLETPIFSLKGKNETLRK